MEKIDAMLKKIIYGCFAVYFFVSLICGCIIKSRLEHYMDECRQYREQLELAENRESEIRAAVDRTGLILGQTTNSIGELREKLKEVENSYNSLWNMFYDNDDNVSDREEQIGETKDVQ